MISGGRQRTRLPTNRRRARSPSVSGGTSGHTSSVGRGHKPPHGRTRLKSKITTLTYKPTQVPDGPATIEFDGSDSGPVTLGTRTLA